MRFSPSHSFALGLIVLAGSVAESSAVAFDKKSGNAQERKDDARVRDAKEDVQQAREKLNAAEKELARSLKDALAADVRERAAVRGIEAARDKVEERLGKKVGLDVEFARQKEALAEYEKAKAPVVERLKASAEYQAAVKSGEAAMEQLRALRGDDSLSDEQRKAKSTELTRQSLAASKLETSAVASDEAASAAQGRLGEIQKKVMALRDKIRKEVDAEPDVKKAIAEAETARETSKRADQEVAKDRRGVAQARAKLNDEQAHLLKAQAQDKKNDGKKKGKG